MSFPHFLVGFENSANIRETSPLNKNANNGLSLAVVHSACCDFCHVEVFFVFM